MNYELKHSSLCIMHCELRITHYALIITHFNGILRSILRHLRNHRKSLRRCILLRNFLHNRDVIRFVFLLRSLRGLILFSR